MNNRRLVLVLMGILLGACGFVCNHATADTTLAIRSTNNPDAREAYQQNVAISLFDAGIPDDTSVYRQLRVFPEVRAVEARLLPFVLREILIESDQWGAVRVVPAENPGNEILVNGKILESNGETLTVQLRAIDSFGNEWVNANYSMASGTSDSNSKTEISTSFQNVFRQFSDDLLAAREACDTRKLRQNREVALLRYASNLLPDAYSQYLQQADNSTLEIARLPAQDDPMLERIRRIREFEYRFIDAIDEQYESLYTEIAQTYNLWLRYQERLTRYRLDGEQQRRSSGSSGKRGSYSAMKESYEHYKWLKMEEQNLRNWARGFSNEVDPTVIEVEGRIVKLDGSLEQRYEEWSGILRSIFQVETGLPSSN